MPLSLHAAAVPQLVRSLKALSGVLAKAESHANALSSKLTMTRS